MSVIKADRLAVENYARECAKAAYYDLNEAEQVRSLQRSNTEVAALYLIDQDGVELTDEDREAFGAEYKRELQELREG
ncbi:hypothetical protein RDMS_01580 [Deinococcus sp. RL]|uniref:hypothetical protein n=1 Tax=Deinococcus sp. RL TaxID=1489678 RepID=UPI0004DB0753|nr:hypothetical protein [Deinococcus sp. RL]KEF35472.1 hypothetical protein RDMS_01580 [Deinococcus sp. RL]